MNALEKSKPESTDIATIEQQIEQHAQRIEVIQREAVFEIGKELSAARALFHYDRREGGFQGWVESRLSISRMHADRLIRIYEGIGEECNTLVTLSQRALLETAAAEPDIKAIIAERVEAGEVFTAAQVKEIKDAAAKQAKEFKEKLAASEKSALERIEEEKSKAEKRVKELESTPSIVPDEKQPTFDAARDAEIKAKQDEIDALTAKIATIQNDPVMKAMRQAVEDAARGGGKKPSNKNPDYKKPTQEYDLMMSVVGSCRIMSERHRNTTPEQILAGFHDDAHRVDGLEAIRKCRDFLTSILEFSND